MGRIKNNLIKKAVKIKYLVIVSWRVACEFSISVEFNSDQVPTGSSSRSCRTQWCDSFLKQVKFFDGREKHFFQIVLDLNHICFICKHIKV